MQCMQLELFPIQLCSAHKPFAQTEAPHQSSLQHVAEYCGGYGDRSLEPAPLVSVKIAETLTIWVTEPCLWYACWSPYRSTRHEQLTWLNWCKSIMLLAWELALAIAPRLPILEEHIPLFASAQHPTLWITLGFFGQVCYSSDMQRW